MSNLAGDLLVGGSELSAEFLGSEICPNLTSRFGPPRKSLKLVAWESVPTSQLDGVPSFGAA